MRADKYYSANLLAMAKHIDERRSHTLLWVYHAAPGENLSITTQIETTRALQSLGWNVTLVLKEPDSDLHIQDLNVHYIKEPRAYLIGYFVFHLKLLHYVLKHWTEVDILLAHQMSVLWLLPFRTLRALFRRPRPLIVMDTRDLVQASHRLKDRFRKRYYWLTHWIANHTTDGQTAITEPMARLVKIPKAKLWGIWPSGVDPTRFVSSYEARTWPQEDSIVELIYIGVLLQERNLLSLCRAVVEANAEGMTFRFTIIGNGPMERELQAVARASGSVIRILPSVSHEKVPEILSHAHIGVTALPDVNDVKYQVSSPIKLFEYMASGLPVLSTPNICHTTVVENWNFAFWANEPTPTVLRAALRNIWLTRTALKPLGQNAILASRLWSWSVAAGKLSSALNIGLVEKGVDDA